MTLSGPAKKKTRRDETPDQLLAAVRELVRTARKEGEEGIEKPESFYERVEGVLKLLDESCCGGGLPEEWRGRESRAAKILADGLRYHEHDGHDMPKRVAREALEELGVPWDEQP